MLPLAGSLVPKFHLLFLCNLQCYLKVFLYQLKPRAWFYVRDTGHERLVDQLTKKSQRSPGDGQAFYKLADGRNALAS